MCLPFFTLGKVNFTQGSAIHPSCQVYLTFIGEMRSILREIAAENGEFCICYGGARGLPDHDEGLSNRDRALRLVSFDDNDFSPRMSFF